MRPRFLEVSLKHEPRPDLTDSHISWQHKYLACVSLICFAFDTIYILTPVCDNSSSTAQSDMATTVNPQKRKQ